MKDLLIHRIMCLIAMSKSGAIEDQKFDNMRWRDVAVQMHIFAGGDTETKAFRKSLSTFYILPEDLKQLSDTQLLSLYELVVRRSSMQM